MVTIAEDRSSWEQEKERYHEEYVWEGDFRANRQWNGWV